MQNYQASQFLYGELIPLKIGTEEIRAKFSEKLDISLDLSFLSVERQFQVFTHKSFTHENKDFKLNNERLEFVGDAVLDLLISDLIFKKFMDKSEGELSKIRSSLVNEKSLAEVAQKLELGKYILLGRGELKLKGHEKKSLLSDVFEALLGAIYMDHGYPKAQSFFQDLLSYLEEKFQWNFLDLRSLENFDAKTKLQEIVMEKYKEVPTYEAAERIENKESTFTVKAFVKGVEIAELSGPSKKKTTQALAKKILDENLLEKYSEKLC